MEAYTARDSFQLLRKIVLINRLQHNNGPNYRSMKRSKAHTMVINNVAQTATVALYDFGPIGGLLRYLKLSLRLRARAPDRGCDSYYRVNIQTGFGTLGIPLGSSRK